MKNQKEKIIYDMLKEFYYEKNGLNETIEFLTYIIKELKEIQQNEEK